MSKLYIGSNDLVLICNDNDMSSVRTNPKKDQREQAKSIRASKHDRSARRIRVSSDADAILQDMAEWGME
jgi:hypothetical protein